MKYSSLLGALSLTAATAFAPTAHANVVIDSFDSGDFTSTGPGAVDTFITAPTAIGGNRRLVSHPLHANAQNSINTVVPGSLVMDASYRVDLGYGYAGGVDLDLTAFSAIEFDFAYVDDDFSLEIGNMSDGRPNIILLSY